MLRRAWYGRSQWQVSVTHAQLHYRPTLAPPAVPSRPCSYSNALPSCRLPERGFPATVRLGLSSGDAPSRGRGPTLGLSRRDAPWGDVCRRWAQSSRLARPSASGFSGGNSPRHRFCRQAFVPGRSAVALHLRLGQLPSERQRIARWLLLRLWLLLRRLGLGHGLGLGLGLGLRRPSRRRAAWRGGLCAGQCCSAARRILVVAQQHTDVESRGDTRPKWLRRSRFRR